jgi:hypothetical protein
MAWTGHDFKLMVQRVIKQEACEECHLDICRSFNISGGGLMSTLSVHSNCGAHPV